MLTTFIHSHLVEKLGNSAKFYYYCRLIDSMGRGRVVIHRDDVCSQLDISRATFYRYISNPIIISNYSFDKDSSTYVVYYKSLTKVAIHYHIKQLGSITEVSLEELKCLKKISTLIEALGLQRQSEYCAKKTMDKKGYTQILNVEEIFKELDINRTRSYSSSVNRSGALVTTKSVYYPTNYSAAPFGVSLDKIADCLNKSIRTISRRLHSVEKIRQFLTKPEYAFHYSLRWMDDADILDQTQYYFAVENSDGTANIYRSYCNLYSPVYTLHSKSYLRSRVKFAYAKQYESNKGLTDKKLWHKVCKKEFTKFNVDRNIQADPELTIQQIATGRLGIAMENNG